MRRFIIAILLAGFACSLACSGNNTRQFEKVIEKSELLLADLKVAESSLNNTLLSAHTPETQAQGCNQKIGMDSLEKKLSDIQNDLDRLKPADMPMHTETIQLPGVDPTTNQPILETTTSIDWGKVTGGDQKMWASVYAIHTALSIAVKTAEVACQCIDSKDKGSIFCSILELEKGRLNLELDAIGRAHIAPAREIIASEKNNK